MVARTLIAALLLMPVAGLSFAQATPDTPITQDQTAAVPAALDGFRGMMVGKLIEKGESTFVFEIQRISRVWRANRAENPERAIGQRITISLRDLRPNHREAILRNYAEVQAGNTIEVEAFDMGGEMMKVMELLRKVEAEAK